MVSKRRESLGAAREWVHDAVGSGPRELGLRTLGVRSGHDAERTIDLASRQHRRDGIGIACKAHDHRGRTLDTGELQHLVIRRVTLDHEKTGFAGKRTPSRVPVDHDDGRAALGRKTLRDTAADTAVATQQGVPVHATNPPIHASPSEPNEVRLDLLFEDAAERVERGRHSEDHEEDREDLGTVVERLCLAEADGRDRRRGLVERVDEGIPLDGPEPECPDGPDHAEEQEADPGSATTPH